MRRFRAGFTLIELLIVIAIIAILAAILFPVFSQARNKGRQAACLSNERQISSAWLMYSQDYDETVLPWSVCGRSNCDAFAWNANLQSYLKNNEVYRCPSAADSLIAYTYSANVGGASPSPDPLRAVASIAFPAQTPVIAECAGFGFLQASDPASNIQGWTFSFIAPSDTGDYQVRAIKYTAIDANTGAPTGERQWGATVVSGKPSANRLKAALIKADQHSDGANYIFADGHAKWLHTDRDKTTGAAMPPKTGLDYDSDGILGDDPNAPGGSTAGKYD